MPVDGTTIAAQDGAAAGLWTHTPVDWAGNEPGKTKAAAWPANASQGYMSTGGGTRPGGAETQSGPAGAPLILSLQETNITATGFGVAVVFDATVTSCRINYGVTTAVASTAAGTTAAAQTIAVGTLTTKTTYWYQVQATNANGTSLSALFQVTTA
jgi:hypothetical protein